MAAQRDSKGRFLKGHKPTKRGKEKKTIIIEKINEIASREQFKKYNPIQCMYVLLVEEMEKKDKKDKRLVLDVSKEIAQYLYPKLRATEMLSLIHI